MAGIRELLTQTRLDPREVVFDALGRSRRRCSVWSTSRPAQPDQIRFARATAGDARYRQAAEADRRRPYVNHTYGDERLLLEAFKCPQIATISTSCTVPAQ